MSEEALGQVVGQVLGAIDEAARLLDMSSSRSQVNVGAAVVLGVATVAVAAAVGGLVYFSEGKTSWSRKKRHYPLTRQQWTESFEPREGRLVDPERVINRARRGGIDISIRAEVWPFILGLYDLNSTEAERAAADFIHLEEFNELRRQCGVLKEYITTELKRLSLEKDDSGSFEKVNEAEVLESMLEANQVIEGEDCSELRSITDSVEEAEALQTMLEANQVMHDEEGIESPLNIDSVEEADAVTTVDSDKPVRRAFSINPKVDIYLEKGPKALEDFRDWLRIIRLDAVRMNAEWVPYSAVQANVTEEQAEKRADEVGMPVHAHLEASRTHHAARLVSILEAYTLYDPDTGYCQGMSDLLSPFVALMESDSEAFWCFVQFMRKAKDNFRTDEIGIRRQLQLVAQIFKVSDPHFYEYLQRIQGEDCFFVYRMVVVLLRRELTFEQTVCLWEVIWADWAALKMTAGKQHLASRDNRRKFPASKDFLLFTIAAAVLQRRRYIIERCRGVDEILRECNAMAGHLDIWELIDNARDLLRDFEHKVGHEKND